jgi:phospholipid-binding lipoprotein MlaA
MRSTSRLIALLALLSVLAAACAPASLYKPRPAGEPAPAEIAGPGATDSPASAKTSADDMLKDEFADEDAGADGTGSSVESEIPDPIEPFNRAMFVFNDRLYFWVLKPVSQGYAAIVPEGGRIAVRNFFTNILTPIRAANCFLQFKGVAGQRELVRFVINSTAGLAGFFDVAHDWLDLARSDEDLGQTLGSYGIDNGFYIVWPVLGASSLRDSVGTAGDSFLNPINYVSDEWYVPVAIQAYSTVNNTSLRIGDYEALKNASLEPYTAFKNAYVQYRWAQVRQ